MPKTVRKWLSRHRQERLAGLNDLPGIPLSCPHKPVFALDASTGADDNYLQRFANTASQPNRRQPSNENPGKEPDGITEQQGPISYPGGSF